VGAEFQSIINHVWLLMVATLYHILAHAASPVPLPSPEGCGPFRPGSMEGNHQGGPRKWEAQAVRRETRHDESRVSFLAFITVSTPLLTGCEPPSISTTPTPIHHLPPTQPTHPHYNTKHPTPGQSTKHGPTMTGATKHRQAVWQRWQLNVRVTSMTMTWPAESGCRQHDNDVASRTRA